MDVLNLMHVRQRLLLLLLALAPVLACRACATPAGDTEIRVTDPSIFRAHVVDAEGRAVSTYTRGSHPAPVVRVLTSGFTPVREVILVTRDARFELGMTRVHDKVFEIPLDQVVAEYGNSMPEVLEFHVVAVDIEGDETTSAPLDVQLVAAAH